MKKEYPDYTVTAEMYNGHLGFWTKHGKLSKANRYFNVMKEQDISPVASNFFTMLSYYCDSKYFDAEKFETIIQTMKTHNISLSDADAQFILNKLEGLGIQKHQEDFQ